MKKINSIPEIRTMEEFASHIGLSRPTVSKYFNDPTSIRNSTRLLIENALAEFDFRPNLFAVNLKRRRTKILGVIIPDTLDPFYMELTRKIEEIAEKNGYFAVVLSSQGQVSRQSDAIERLQSMHIAGAIIAPIAHSASQDKLNSLADRIPLVYVDSKEESDVPFVGTDNRQSFGLIIDYLCRSGEPPCFLGMPGVNANSISRRVAYEEAMIRNGFKPLILQVDSSNSWEFEKFGYEQTIKNVKNGLPTNTILCANDRIAFGALHAAWEMGIKVGHGLPSSELRIAGHDDHPLARYTSPPLTTVAQDYALIAQIAMQKLMDLFDTEDWQEPSKLKEHAKLKDQLKQKDQTLLKASLMLRRSA